MAQTEQPQTTTRDFWSENPEFGQPGGIPYISSADLANSGEAFEIRSIVDDQDNTYKGNPSPRWILTIALIERDHDQHYTPDGELVDETIRKLTLAMNPQREPMIARMRAFMADTNSPVYASLKWVAGKTNGFYTLEPVSIERAAQALAVYHQGEAAPF